ncbi:MAG: FliM/FliN family flagellar motor switch protein [Gemmatimonadaceae bacterium]|nr:FliM/FliN family flagellar motor switch protein [Gemmatimonadaceae bacterium]
MAMETLSQNEIDALLGGAAAVAAPPARSLDNDVQIYDFRRPHRVSKERLRALEAMYERLCKSLEAWLIGRVRGQVELRLQSVEQFSFGEFVLALPTPCASFGFEIMNTGGQKGVIDVGNEFSYFLVDRFFGGGGNAQTMQRALSPIERLVVRILVDRCATLLTEIWQDHVDLDLDIQSFESFPDMVQACSREDPVLVANIEVNAGTTNSLLLLCLPFSVLDKFFSSGEQQRVKEMTGSERERKLTRELTEQSLRATGMELTARLPAFRIPLRQLLGLPVGSVLGTGISTDTPLELSVGGQPRYRGAVGRVGGKLAVRLTDVPAVPTITPTAS